MDAVFFGNMIETNAARRRWSILSRVLAASVGGYAFTSLLTLAFPLAMALLGFNQAQALLAATTWSFLVYATVIMAVFHARSATRAWAWLVVASIPPGVVTALLLPGAVP